MMLTTQTDVSDLARVGEALPVLEQWSKKAAREDQIKLSWANAYVESDISRAELEWALQRSQNALTGLSARDVHPAVRDARVDYPLSFLVRGAMQHVCEVPTVEQFIDVLKRFPDHWAAPMWDQVHRDAPTLSKDDAWKGMRYRASVAWQSFIREQHALAGLRSFGFPVHSHPIADVVLLIDGWYERHTFSVYVDNTEFLGRKSPSPLKNVVNHHLIAPKQPGNPGVWLVPDWVIEQCADRIGDDGESADSSP